MYLSYDGVTPYFQANYNYSEWIDFTNCMCYVSELCRSYTIFITVCYCSSDYYSSFNCHSSRVDYFLAFIRGWNLSGNRDINVTENIIKLVLHYCSASYTHPMLVHSVDHISHRDDTLQLI